MLRIGCIVLLTARLLYAQGGITSSSAGGTPAGPNLTAPAASTPPEQRCVVQGRVTNAQTGEPLRKANIHLVKHGQPGGTVGAFMPGLEGYSEVSGADGTFQFDGVEPGQYSLSGERSGFLRTEYRAKGAYSSGTNITLNPSQHLTNLELGLTPQAVITGRVVDQDGDPVGGLMVMAMRQMWMQGKSQYLPAGNANTDEQGEFRLPNLQPGKYYISAQKMQFGGMEMPVSPDKPDIRPVRTFYPDSMTRDAAVAVPVKPGQTIPGIEIRLRSVATHHVRGKVAGDLPATGEMLNLTVVPEEDDFPFGMGPRNAIKPDHSFDIAGLAPGRYWISAMQYSGSVRSLAQATVEVGSSDVNDVVLATTAAGTLRGQITLQGTPSGQAADVKRVRVILVAGDRRRALMTGQSETKENGAFTIATVMPGKYIVHVFGQPTGTYVQSVQYGSQDVLNKELDLSQGASGELQVTLHYGVAEVDGSVLPAQSSGDAASKANATVVLIPEATLAYGRTLTGSPDQNAAFSIREVPPGKYYALAVEGLSGMLLQNPEFTKELASKGVEVELKENDKKQIQLPLTPSTDVHQLLARLGIEEQ